MLTNLFFLGLAGQVAATPETFVALNMSDRTYCAVFTTQIEGLLKLNNDNETSTYNWKMGGNDSHALDFCSANSDRSLDANCAEVRLPLENGSVMVFKNMQVAAFQSFKLSKWMDGLEYVDFKHLLLTSLLPVLIGAFAALVVACALVGTGVVLCKRRLERTAGYADL
ncbi:unnamed protein product, partial [Mesorhabditis spiculigera]